jgi:hypothetical protein
MRYKNLYKILLVLSLGLFSSCSDVLNQSPDGKISLDEVFQDNDKVSAYLNTCYKYMPGKGVLYYFWERGPACWCDEAWDADDIDVSWTSSAMFYNGGASAEYHPVWGVGVDYGQDAKTDHYWENYFTSIHDCAYFLANIEKATVNSETDRSRWTAEAHLLRAYYYEELLRWFGCGMPLVDTPYTYTDDFSTVKRASYYETVQFIMKDCEAALKCPDLPWRITTSDETGRLPKALAYAIESRMMLYAASPLYCGSDNYWEEAYKVTKAAKDGLKAQGFELYNTLHNTKTFYSKYSYFGPDDYALAKTSAMLNEYFCTDMEYSAAPIDRETIYQTQKKPGSSSSTIEGIGAVKGYKSGACPSQELVDCFETINGQTILNLDKPYNDEETHLDPNYNTANTMYDPQNPYVNRDPRFYADVYYNDSKRYGDWPFDETNEAYENAGGKKGFRTRRIMTYEGEPETGTSANGRTKTRTGYFIRKYTNPTVSGADLTSQACYKEFRYAEVILNFAEAAAHAGKEDEARAAVNEIRTRAGMPSLPSSLTGDALIKRIINERRVELALEEARFFDVRRLHLPNENLSKTDKWVTAAKITRNTDGSFTYARKSVNGNPRLCYSNKWLKTAIPLKEINNIISISGENWQNPGW